MTDRKHSPGPWAIGRDDRPGMEWNNHIVERMRPNMAICFMTHSGKDDNSEAEANASLIAAAPDLLDALESVWLWMENQADGQSKGGHATFDLMMLREQRDIAYEAIEKAKSIQCDN